MKLQQATLNHMKHSQANHQSSRGGLHEPPVECHRYGVRVERGDQEMDDVDGYEAARGRVQWGVVSVNADGVSRGNAYKINPLVVGYC